MYHCIISGNIVQAEVLFGFLRSEGSPWSLLIMARLIRYLQCFSRINRAVIYNCYSKKPPWKDSNENNSENQQR